MNLILVVVGIFILQTVFENSLMQHHVALPPDAMGKITYVAPPGQYSLKVCHLCHVMCPCSLVYSFCKTFSLIFIYEIE